MNSNRMKYVVTCLVLLLIVWAHGHALESDKDQPMHLEADSLSVDEASGVVLYEGSVEITQGSLRIWADRLWIHRRQGKTERVIGEGSPVRFRQLTEKGDGEVHGEARRVEINAERDELLLIDDASLEQGGNRFRNDRIIYNRAKAMVKAGTSAQGKQRVQVVIEPKKQP
ncbi:MAG: lipopolysaccharide transport periplasmic protein LptA [Candidatus Thiodiazotropha endolucinida]|uniref:Lipopolysaccharide export system protein LptA n=2 Tax=Candidatus Thiodiazotropha endolucinida TaxID=1655433 RepID=A0A7Z1AFI4_9GAMM|nr:lipopolysaccharide transport periplasmic protein LptA [Candidatus Thiodiazotropha endolucinida]ODJ87912.1 lipopolysaccharide export system protein LptA precursor [Candidatus Thiodiazotropha endolucinida]